MIPFGYWLRLGAFTLGAALHLFLAVVVLQKRHRETADWPLLAALVLAGFWHAFYAFPLIRGAVTGQESEVPALPDSGQAGSVVALLLVGLALGSAWVLCVRAVRRKAFDRRIAGLYGMSVAVLLGPLAGGVAGPASGEIAFASLLTPAVFAYSIYRYNAFGLLIGQRVVFAVRFGALLVIYLVAVRAVAKWAGGGPEFDETVVEFVLILAALLISVPLYGWMSRFLFRQSQLYAGFSKRLTEEAARILDLSKRLQFIAEEVGRTFALRRVILATATEPPVRGEFGMGAAGECEHPIGEARELVLRQRADVYHRDRTTSPEMRKLLATAAFLLASTAAQAQYTFEYGGRTIRIDPDRGTEPAFVNGVLCTMVFPGALTPSTVRCMDSASALLRRMSSDDDLTVTHTAFPSRSARAWIGESLRTRNCCSAV